MPKAAVSFILFINPELATGFRERLVWLIQLFQVVEQYEMFLIESRLHNVY